MADPVNPWLPPRPTFTTALPTRTGTALTGPSRPQHGVPAPDLVDQLPVRRAPRTATLWVLGPHGGAGESTVAELGDMWVAAGHAWPAGTPGRPNQVLVAARTSARGLTAAKNAARQWAAGLVSDVELVGLVLTADAPGRLPKPLRDLAKVVAGGYPRTWQLPWVEAWRCGDDVHADSSPREAHHLVNDLTYLLNPLAPLGVPTERNDNDGPHR